MGLVQYFVIVLMLSAQLVLTSPVTNIYIDDNGEECYMCPPGEYKTTCKECEPCPPGSYTSEWNIEDRCHHCFGDCKSDYHLEVSSHCTNKADVKCVCKAGFKCIQNATYSENCAFCDKIQEAATVATVGLLGNNKPRSSTVSTGHSSTITKPCQPPKCHSDPQTSETDVSVKLEVILCSVVFMACVIFVILFRVCHPGDETCFKKAILKLRNEGKQDASHKSKESSHQFPRDSSSAKQQLPFVSAANLGPVHVHNPGTVILSMLSHFTGQVGPTIDGSKAAEAEEEEDERDFHVCHPTSPSIHLSEEERSGDIDSIFFPSQEQGKDCHVSKEEEP